MKDDPILKVTEAAKEIGMSEQWVYENLDLLPHYRIGKAAIRFRKSKLLEWLENQSVMPKNGKQDAPRSTPKEQATTQEFTILDGDRLKEAWKRSP